MKHLESLFCVLVPHVFHVVLYRRIVSNKAFFTHLLEEDKINISLVVFFICQTFFQQFDILICFQDSPFNPPLKY